MPKGTFAISVFQHKNLVFSVVQVFGKIILLWCLDFEKTSLILSAGLELIDQCIHFHDFVRKVILNLDVVFRSLSI